MYYARIINHRRIEKDHSHVSKMFPKKAKPKIQLPFYETITHARQYHDVYGKQTFNQGRKFCPSSGRDGTGPLKVGSL